MPSSYQVVLWKQESFGILRRLQIEFFRNLLGAFVSCHPEIETQFISMADKLGVPKDWLEGAKFMKTMIEESQGDTPSIFHKLLDRFQQRAESGTM